MRENNAHKKQICTISEKNRHNPIDMVSTTATTTITTKPKQKWRRLVVVEMRPKNERGRNIHIAVVLFWCIKNIIIQGIANKWIRYECSACLNFRMRKFSLASDSEWQQFLALGEWGLEILRWHSYWEDIITHNPQVIFRDAKILTRDSIIIIWSLESGRLL